MKWIVTFLTSSIGKKMVMSLTGLFLCTFLIVHAIGNLQLFVPDEGVTFNQYAYFMTTNPLIKTVSYGLYFFILLHAVQGTMIWLYNKSASGGMNRYSGKESAPTEAKIASKNMMYLGILIFAFIGIHMAQFWFKMKIGALETSEMNIGGKMVEVNNLYAAVEVAFKQPLVVVFYLVSLAALALHLLHGFQSAFQTLGLNHKKYTPLIKGLGIAFSILVPLIFASMPIYFLAMG